jgi:putative CocE/NonD family hydrolase
MATEPVKSSGTGAGERQLNGPQTTGREFRNLSEPAYNIQRTNDVDIPMRDGIRLKADLFQPEAEKKFPALIAASPYPRQIQDFGLPMGLIEAGASDFFVPRGYAHLIVNLRGTCDSEGTWNFADPQERDDLYDMVEWAAAQPWCDGNVGMVGISYFAVTQVEAAVKKPPHLKAIFPLALSDDMYETAYHFGLFSSGFISSWLPAIGVMAAKNPQMWRNDLFKLVKDAFRTPIIHKRLEHVNGEAVMVVLKKFLPGQYAEEPYGRLWQEVALEHPARDAFWDDRNIQALLQNIDIPVYLGCDWDNVPMHLPSTFAAWKALRNNPNVRMGMLPAGALTWPWESMHVEVLAWYDHWLKGRDTGIMEGDPIRYVIPGAGDEYRTATSWPPPEATLTAFALGADGELSIEEGPAGSRTYRYLPLDSGEPAHMNPSALPAILTWDTLPMTEALDFAGDIELQLDASITALDTGFFVALHDVAENGDSEPITVGWLRASLSTVDEANSTPGSPSLEGRVPKIIPVAERVSYRVPITPNARRIAPGHRLQLVLGSSDEDHKELAMLGFTHTPVRQASLTTVFSSSRLLLPVLPR